MESNQKGLLAFGIAFIVVIIIGVLLIPSIPKHAPKTVYVNNTIEIRYNNTIVEKPIINNITNIIRESSYNVSDDCVKINVVGSNESMLNCVKR